jgi:hypothetical protein
VAGAHAAGKAISIAASRAKTPLIAGGAAIAGLAGGLAVIRRRRATEPGLIERLRDAAGGDGALDLEAIADAARRLGSVSGQVGDVVAAMQKAGEASKR